MKAKANCVPCDWENSRRAVYWSLRRKLSEVVSHTIPTRITLTTLQRIMKKLAVANPNLTYPERQTLLKDFIPAELSADNDVAGYIEKSGDAIETYVQGVKDEYCSDTILSWA